MQRDSSDILFGHMFFLDLCFSGFICLSLGGSSGASKNELQKASRFIVQESGLVEIVCEAASTGISFFQEIHFPCSSGGFQLLYSGLCDQLHRQCCCRANPVAWIQAIQARYTGHFCCQCWESLAWMFEDGLISSDLGVIFLCTYLPRAWSLCTPPHLLNCNHFVDIQWWSPLFRCFFLFESLWCLNEVAKDFGPLHCK